VVQGIGEVEPAARPGVFEVIELVADSMDAIAIASWSWVFPW
jgi:hypothetical protein